MAIVRFDTISQYNAFNNHETLHPLVSVIDLSKAAPRQFSRMSYGFYTIFLKDVVCGDLRYGKQYYDYQEGTLIFLAPGQLIGVENNGEYYQPQGYSLYFTQICCWERRSASACMNTRFSTTTPAKHFTFQKGKGRRSWRFSTRSNMNWSTP